MQYDKKQIVMALSFSLAFVLGAGIGYSAPGDVTDGLELEGNIIDDSPPAGQYDWSNLFDVSGDAVPTPKGELALPTGYYSPVFVRDFEPGKKGPDESTFTTGSKDILDIDPGWECAKANNVTDKGDIVNAYATAFIAPDGDVILYMAQERTVNNGDANVAFWFLQDPTVGCTLVGRKGSFTGHHVDGDILIVSEFTKGGTVSTIEVYRWDGLLATVDPTPIITSTECNGSSDPAACAIVNKDVLDGYGPGTDIPWLTETKFTGNDLDTSLFFEAGLNLTQLDLLACFTKYMAVTRSSQELTATLYDYAEGDFDLCGVEVSKSCDKDSVVLDPDGDSVLTDFYVTAKNTGIASVYDVTLEEDFNFSSGETCQIVEIGGDPSGLPVDITDGTPYQIAAQLDAKQELVVKLVCDTVRVGGFANAVTLKAKSSSALTEPDQNDSYTMVPEEFCPIAPNPLLAVQKECADLYGTDGTPDGVELVQDNGQLVVQVSVDVAVQNTGAEKLIEVTLEDVTPGGGGISFSCKEGTVCDGELSPTGTSDDTEYFTATYRPSAAGSGVSPYPACSSTTFYDKVKATGRGILSGDSVEASDDATCSPCTDCD